jgi:hypothetical protein
MCQAFHLISLFFFFLLLVPLVFGGTALVVPLDMIQHLCTEYLLCAMYAARHCQSYRHDKTVPKYSAKGSC